MDNFLEKFFPVVAEQAKAHSDVKTDAYCTYSNIDLQLFTSSLFLAAAFAGLAGSFTTRCVTKACVVLHNTPSCVVLVAEGALPSNHVLLMRKLALILPQDQA